VKHPGGIFSLYPCHFRTQLFSEGFTGVLDVKTAKRNLRQAKKKQSENVEFTAQPKLRQTLMFWLDS
jgi:hypothetical protein